MLIKPFLKARGVRGKKVKRHSLHHLTLFIIFIISFDLLFGSLGRRAALPHAFHLSAAKQLFPKNKEKKRETDSKRTETRSKSVLEGTSHQQYKPLGKIDLDNLGKKPVGVGSAAPEPVKNEEAKTPAVG